MIVLQVTKRCARLDILAAGDLQLRLRQADRQRRLGLALARLLQQLVALRIFTQLIGCARSTQVMHQRLLILFCRQLQMPQRRRPLPLGKLAQPTARSLLHPPGAVPARPGVDQRPGDLQQPE